LPNAANPIQELAAMLKDSTARPVIVPSRLAPSAIYDVEYRTTLIALVFGRFSKPLESSALKRISAARLKFLQFVTIRPWLLSAVREWSLAGKQEGLAFAYSIRIRRGFLSDTAHDDVMNYLTACEILTRQETQIISGSKVKALLDVEESVNKAGLFASERSVMNELERIRISNDMLEGW
jgi:hypothetical protein